MRTKPGLGKEFDPTIAGCGPQGTASSPSSTVAVYYIRKGDGGNSEGRKGRTAQNR